jgi:hypothetical protein
MNERIESWLKNHLVKSEYTEFGWQECHRYEFDDVELKEFAELVVRECIDIVSPYAIRMENFDGGHPIADLKKHFGVEE